MKKSDAVILIVNADRPSFNDSLVQFFESVDKDDDGISIGEKLFVFANRADIATTLQDNLQRIREELQKLQNHANGIDCTAPDGRLRKGKS